jgi:hypothetical protein
MDYSPHPGGFVAAGVSGSYRRWPHSLPVGHRGDRGDHQSVDRQERLTCVSVICHICLVKDLAVAEEENK